MRIQIRQAFTLVELIVVITILAILATVAFVSYEGQVEGSRNTARQSDISALGSALKNHKLKNGAYPNPGDYFNIMNNGTGNIVAKQGFMNSKVYSTEITTSPLDPNYKIPYLYSITKNNQFYELATIIEPLTDADTTKTYLVGDYQTVSKDVLPTILLATSTGANNNIEIASGTIAGNINRLTFLANNSTLNLAYGNDLTTPTSTATTFDSIFTESGVTYSQFPGYSSCQEIYEAGRSIGSGSYQVLDTAGAVTSTGCSMVFTVVSLKSVSNCGTSTGVIYGTTDGTDVGLTCSNDIIICNGTTGSGYTLSACNVGSNIVGTGTASYGNYFQWGRNDGFGSGITTITGTLYTGINNIAGGINLSATNWANKFITGSTIYNYNWLSNTGTSSDVIWGQGPCVGLYHIPTQLEWSNVITSGGWGTNGTNMNNALKMPLAGSRDGVGGSYNFGSSYGLYRSSSPYLNTAYSLCIASSTISSNNYTNHAFGGRADGFSVRCIKN